ncbi:glycosyl hydrolase family 17 protein [Adhaeretor mobilis]|uniref:Endo-1,3-beta-glucanase btgC n=1 Tax=Adhaeretor mobilis TaxID=1930276 RepID=A0A517MYG7_9BACT|nr:glycosyl hydrolase family 17 protein [Adhaeretor mobilis]QDS99909.1 Glycosyl hydrolases family 17 [Adhaeretor mobilis]
MLKLVMVAMQWALLLSVGIYGVAGTASADDGEPSEQFKQRAFEPKIDGKWIGQGISYGPYRKGQAPNGEQPTKVQMREDLVLLSKNWQLLRIYGSRGVASDILEIIRQEKLSMKVMLGAWITRENDVPGQDMGEFPAAVKANKDEVAGAIQLANEYPDVVIAVSVGNESQVYWSDHITKPEVLIRCLREVRSATKIPVTTADDFNFWNKPESQAVAEEIDFIVTHLHAHWAGNLLHDAMPWTQKVYKEVCQHHPDKTVVIGEAGWATQVHNEGEQAKLIKGKAGEKQQLAYYQEFTSWASNNKICTFYFEAFDEPWKGGPHPNEVEKHWGLYRVDRKPKQASLHNDP